MVRDELAARIAAFWQWIVREETDVRRQFLDAVARSDHRALEALVERIGAQLAVVAPGLSVRLNGGPGTFRLAILSPEPAVQAIAREVLAHAPVLAGWAFCDSIPSPAKNFIVRDGEGRELIVAYRAVTFALLPPKPDGSVSVLFALDETFDPKGERGHLYQAAANEILKHTFGGVPPGMSTFALVPRAWLGARPSRPLDELARVWADRNAVLS